MRIIKIILAVSLFLWVTLLNGILCYAGNQVSEDIVINRKSVKKIFFSGYEWEVKAGRYYPGKNDWLAENVWVDSEGFLHIKITYDGRQWYCGELSTVESFGYGRYQFQVIGAVDQLDPNMVLGLFVYPSPENPDESNEIDIEYAKWGKPESPIGNFTVTPAETTYHFPSSLDGNYTTHQFIWTKEEVLFQSFHGHTVKEDMEFANWLYRATAYQGKNAIPPVRVHMNLWLFRGLPPLDGKEQEIIIKKFAFSA